MEKMSKATLGGGCFWCLEAAFRELRGIREIVSGYAGGHVANPSYEQVCSEDTGHAEVVQITFDPDELSYRDLLRGFFAIHDPTTVDRQGGDIGSQYRSVIFYHDDEQKRVAEELMAELEREDVFGAPIVTQLLPAPEFYPAEAYHQEYYRNNPLQPYCMFVVRPKVAKMREVFGAGRQSSSKTSAK
jgi:peptide-methionine (S)-S-oxide reductase